MATGWNMVGPTEDCAVPADAHTVYTWNEVYTIVAEQGSLLRGVGYWIFKNN